MKRKVYKIEVMVVDIDDVGDPDIATLIENAHYPNHAIAPHVMRIESREVDWSDDHPLNKRDSQDAEYLRLFAQ